MHSKRMWSESLGTWIRLRITARVLRTVDKVGGLDEYLLGEKAGRVKGLGMGGWKLRWRIMQTEAVKERFRLQREVLGLEPKANMSVGSDGKAATKMEVDAEIQRFDADLAKGAAVELVEEDVLAVGQALIQEEPVRQDKVLL